MADGSKVLKEFLVKIGFKTDETKFRHFLEAMHKTAQSAVEITKAFAKVGTATVAGTAASALMLKRVSDGLAGLYYSAQRTASSVSELKVLQYGFEQVGLSASDAQQSVESLAAARRQNPGLNGLLAGFGIDPNQVDSAKVFVELLGRLRTMQPYIRAQYAGMFGLNEGVVNQLELNGPAFQAAMKRREEIFRKEGYNPDDAAKKAIGFERAWNDAKARYSDMGQELAVKLLPVAERFAAALEHIADWLLATDKATGGWVSTLGALALALTPILGALKLSGGLGILGKVLGGAGRVAVGGIDAVGLGGIAALGGLGYLAASKTAAAKVAHALGMKDRYTLDDVKGWVQSAMDKTGLSNWVAGFEGHAKNGYGVYRDIAGHLTAGFGHLVQPGEHLENLDRQGALALLAKDLAKARAAVLKWVHVKLTQNQLSALTDFEFNIGEGKFSRSTLLRKLNAGDYSGAGNEFQRWNHAFVDGHWQTVAGLTARRAAEASMYRTADRPIQLTQHNEYHVTSTDPKGAADEFERRQKRVNADLVRNFATAVQ